MVQKLLKLPSFIRKDGKEYEFRLFINHEHLRCAYMDDEGNFIHLAENIESDEDLEEYIDMILSL